AGPRRRDRATLRRRLSRHGGVPAQQARGTAVRAGAGGLAAQADRAAVRAGLRPAVGGVGAVGSPAMMAEPMIGTKINNYQICSLLGQGGMGTVYLCEHPVLGRRAAIKVLHREYAGNPSYVT